MLIVNARMQIEDGVRKCSICNMVLEYCTRCKSEFPEGDERIMCAETSLNPKFNPNPHRCIKCIRDSMRSQDRKKSYRNTRIENLIDIIHPGVKK